MKGEFIMIAVCATLVHIALVKVSPTAATIRKDDIDDIQLMRFYRKAAILQLKEAIEIVLPHNLQGYLTKAGIKDDCTYEDNVNGTEICANKLLVRGLGALDAMFAAVSIEDPQITSATTSAYDSLKDGLLDVTKGLCSALRLAVGKKGPTTVAKIQAIADKVASASVNWNQQYFDTVRPDRDLQLEIELMIEEAEDQSTDLFVRSSNELFIGLQKLAALDLHTESEKILSLMDTVRNRVYDTAASSVGKKFDIIEILFLTPPIIRPASRNVTVECKSTNPTETSALQIQKGVAAMFATILRLLAKTPVKNSVGYRNDSANTASAKDEISDAFNSAIDTAINGVLKINPECSSIIKTKRDVVHKKINKIVDKIYGDIDAIGKTEPGTISIQLEVTKNETMHGATELVVDLFDAIASCVQRADSRISLPPRKLFDTGLPGFMHTPAVSRLGHSLLTTPTCMCMLPVTAFTSPHCANVCANRGKSPAEQTSNPKINAEIQNFVKADQEKSIAKMKKLFQLIFNAIKVRFVEISSGAQAEGGTKTVPAQAEALAAGRAAFKIVIDVIIELLKASANNNIDKSAGLSAIEVYRENTMFQIEKGVDIVFSNIMANHGNIPEDNPSDIIEAGRASTSAHYLSALENNFCVLAGSRIPSAAEQEASSQMEIAGDGVYEVIRAAQSDKSCRILPKLGVLEARTANNFIKMNSKLYNVIRQSPNYNIQTEPVLARMQNSSNSNSKKACAAVFSGIRTLAAFYCSGNQTSSVDDLFSVTAEYKKAASVLVGWSKAASDAVTSVSPKKEDTTTDPPIKTTVTVRPTITHGIHASINIKPFAPFGISLGL